MDWYEIVVVHGGYWLILIGLALFLSGLWIGYVFGRQRERDRHRLDGYGQQIFPDDQGGSHRA